MCRFAHKRKHRTRKEAEGRLWTMRRQGTKDAAFLSVFKCGNHYHVGRDWMLIRMRQRTWQLPRRYVTLEYNPVGGYAAIRQYGVDRRLRKRGRNPLLWWVRISPTPLLATKPVIKNGRLIIHGSTAEYGWSLVKTVVGVGGYTSSLKDPMGNKCQWFCTSVLHTEREVSITSFSTGACPW